MQRTHSGDQTAQLTKLGSGSMEAPASGPHAGLLEAFPNRHPERPYVVCLSFPEFTSLCPVTGQPDFGTIVVEYIPDERCVESKSFKLYMFAFRDHQSFMETITNTVLNDMVSTLDPLWCRVKGLFAPRGGTRIHVFAEHFKAAERLGTRPGQSDSTALREMVAEWKREAQPHAPVGLV